ncbi:hypothetical protein CYLTODRAFT_485068 [Cylindrobasidium torrendii FP15055 ss-10]|uniref:Uncharacterized protein n=1 Tax=Cylindrobasidium torrendii FP15055 ss-10 TaxID=1314674 RepID=A0A0D7BUS1_9AGAR|nr:hypothetical protein CYLTODRAFT_485068 [Cylindrobasidium torrendii FP15055 ss-10]
MYPRGPIPMAHGRHYGPPPDQYFPAPLSHHNLQRFENRAPMAYLPSETSVSSLGSDSYAGSAYTEATFVPSDRDMRRGRGRSMTPKDRFSTIISQPLPNSAAPTPMTSPITPLSPALPSSSQGSAPGSRRRHRLPPEEQAVPHPTTSTAASSLPDLNVAPGLSSVPSVASSEEAHFDDSEMDPTPAPEAGELTPEDGEPLMPHNRKTKVRPRRKARIQIYRAPEPPTYVSPTHMPRGPIPSYMKHNHQTPFNPPIPFPRRFPPPQVRYFPGGFAVNVPSSYRRSPDYYPFGGPDEDEDAYSAYESDDSECSTCLSTISSVESDGYETDEPSTFDESPFYHRF